MNNLSQALRGSLFTRGGATNEEKQMSHLLSKL
jgi:hypothetical protein